jgi:hypothetical protein
MPNGSVFDLRDFDEKVQAAIRQKLETARRRNTQQANNSNAGES